MNFHQHNALSFSVENILRDDFPRRRRLDGVVDVQTQTKCENLPNTTEVHRCPVCLQLLRNLNTVHSTEETVQNGNVKESMNPGHFNTASGPVRNANEELRAPIQCTDHEQPQMTGRTYTGRETDAVTGIQYKIERMYLELVPDYKEH